MALDPDGILFRIGKSQVNNTDPVSQFSSKDVLYVSDKLMSLPSLKGRPDGASDADLFLSHRDRAEDCPVQVGDIPPPQRVSVHDVSRPSPFLFVCVVMCSGEETESWRLGASSALQQLAVAAIHRCGVLVYDSTLMFRSIRPCVGARSVQHDRRPVRFR